MEQDKQKTGSERSRQLAEPTPLMAAVVEANKAKSNRQRGEVPQFNLAEQIMSQQRKATAVKRKAPAAKGEPVQNPVTSNKSSGFMVSISPRIAGHAKIIAEIVARDIMELCSGKSTVAS
jgi:hypothetical protein